MRKCRECETAQGPFTLIKGFHLCEQCKWRYVQRAYHPKAIEEQLERQKESKIKAAYRRIANRFFPS